MALAFSSCSIDFRDDLNALGLLVRWVRTFFCEDHMNREWTRSSWQSLLPSMSVRALRSTSKALPCRNTGYTRTNTVCERKEVERKQACLGRVLIPDVFMHEGWQAWVCMHHLSKEGSPYANHFGSRCTFSQTGIREEISSHPPPIPCLSSRPPVE